MYPVAEYTYDAWGNATVIYKNGGALSGVACGLGMGVGAILYGAATIATSGAVSYAITGFIAAFSISGPGSFGANILIYRWQRY